MKKSIKILSLILVLALMIIALVACGDEETAQVGPVKLGTPTISVSNTGLVSWTAIEGAVKYGYILNDATDAIETDKTSVQAAPGDKIKVQAIGDGTNYVTGDYCEVKQCLNEVYKMTFTWANTIDKNGAGDVQLTVAFTDIASDKTHNIIIKTTGYGTESVATTVTRGDGEDTKTETKDITVATFTNKDGNKTFYGYLLSDIIANMQNKKADKNFVDATKYVCIYAKNADNAVKIIEQTDIADYKVCYNSQIKASEPVDATTRIEKGTDNNTQQNRVQSLIFYGI